MTILLAWLLADFLAGLIHFVEDKFFSESTMHVFGSINKDNDLHHEKPGAMLSHSWWGNINTSAVFALPLTTVSYVAGWPMLFTLAFFFSTFANLVHRFAHTPRRKLNRFIRFMQKTGLFISFEQHFEHHYEGELLTKEKAYRRYCPMTSYLNPVLDAVNFWSLLERLVKREKSN